MSLRNAQVPTLSRHCSKADFVGLLKPKLSSSFDVYGLHEIRYVLVRASIR